MEPADIDKVLREPVAVMAAIRDAMIAKGFTRAEAVNLAGAWMLQTASQAGSRPEDLQSLLRKLEIKPAS